MEVKPFVGLATTARQLGVPRSWLRREVKAGRIPCLDIGNRRLFDVEAVKASLDQRETTPVVEGAVVTGERADA